MDEIRSSIPSYCFQLDFLDEDPPVMSVLQIDCVVKLVQIEHVPLVDYFLKHSTEVLQIALSDDPNAIPALYILCLTEVERPILRNCLRDSSFTKEAAIAMSNPNIPIHMLARVSSLTIAAFFASQELAMQSCWYLDTLLKYVENTSVLAVFERLVAPNPSMRKVHLWILKYGFVRDLMREISSVLEIDRENPYMDPRIGKLFSCYGLVYICSQNPDIAPAFESEEVLKVLCSPIEGLPPSVDGERIKALTGLCNARTVGMLDAPISEALERLQQPIHVLSKDIVENIYLLTEAADASQAISQRILESHFFNVLLGLVLKFDQASILHGAFRVFTAQGFRNPVLCEPLIDRYLRFLMTEARLRENGQLGASCLFLLNFLHCQRKENRQIDRCLSKDSEFQGFEKDLLKFRKVLLNPYGGKLPKQNPADRPSVLRAD